MAGKRGAAAFFQQLAGIVEKEYAEIEQGRRHGLPIEADVLLGQMPAARPHHQRRGAVVKPVLLALGARKTDCAIDRVAKIPLPFNEVLPRGRIRVLEIGHEDIGPGVQGIDDHFPVGWPGDLNPAILQVVGNWRYYPVGLSDVGGLGKEIGEPARVDLPLSLDPSIEQRLQPRVNSWASASTNIKVSGLSVSEHCFGIGAQTSKPKTAD